jgi:hypothetical protein
MQFTYKDPRYPKKVPRDSIYSADLTTRAGHTRHFEIKNEELFGPVCFITDNNKKRNRVKFEIKDRMNKTKAVQLTLRVETDPDQYVFIMNIDKDKLPVEMDERGNKINTQKWVLISNYIKGDRKAFDPSKFSSLSVYIPPNSFKNEVRNKKIKNLIQFFSQLIGERYLILQKLTGFQTKEIDGEYRQIYNTKTTLEKFYRESRINREELLELQEIGKPNYSRILGEKIKKVTTFASIGIFAEDNTVYLDTSPNLRYQSISPTSGAGPIIRIQPSDQGSSPANKRAAITQQNPAPSLGFNRQRALKRKSTVVNIEDFMKVIDMEPEGDEEEEEELDDFQDKILEEDEDMIQDSPASSNKPYKIVDEKSRNKLASQRHIQEIDLNNSNRNIKNRDHEQSGMSLSIGGSQRKLNFHNQNYLSIHSGSSKNIRSRHSSKGKFKVPFLSNPDGQCEI